MVTTTGVPLRAGLDLLHGGRWVSLSGGGREWLWSHSDPSRAAVAPGSAFVWAAHALLDLGVDARIVAQDGVPVRVFPAGAPYRSVGVEPMLGAVFDLADAGPGDAALVPPCGELTWRLVLAAERTT
ncbi:hypothetical protein ACFLIM_33425 [Nonomuraea sp. M3C6]|uniref:Uncharacterized protein n=1 Tax=Nonomuraea marmarensis TaxID=3351344 RepID=A0ABW7AL61_9ACTN